MATKFASATGNWSTMVWWTTSGGSTTTTAPGVGDDADLNGKTALIDQNVTCDNIVGSGALGVIGSRTINATLGSSGSAWACTMSAAQTVTLNGGIVPGTATKMSVTGASTVFNITGNLSGSATSNARSINQSAGTVTIVGDASGGTGTNAGAVLLSGGTLNLTGNLVDSTTSAISKTGGTFNYTPTNAQTATIGGKTLYPTQGTTYQRNAIGQLIDPLSATGGNQ